MNIDKTPENSTDKSKSQKIYASMAHMSTNAKIPRINDGEIFQVTNSILDSGTTCHKTPEILEFIPGSLAKTDKYIVVADGNLIIEKQTGEGQIKILDINGKPFFPTIYNVLLAPDLCDRLFFIITLPN